MTRCRLLFVTLGACLALAFGPAAFAGGCDSSAKYETTAHNAAKQNLVEVAVAAGSFDTLVAAVQAAGLVDTLQGEGPYTIFAPTDEAFAKISQEQLDALLADREKLVAVLTYHVVPGRVAAADVTRLSSAQTVQGQPLTIATQDGVTVDGASVIEVDIEASNGVIHVIDTVIFPEA